MSVHQPEFTLLLSVYHVAEPTLAFSLVLFCVLLQIYILQDLHRTDELQESTVSTFSSIHFIHFRLLLYAITPKKRKTAFDRAMAFRYTEIEDGWDKRR